MEQIKNDFLTLSISEHGAEMQSIKDNKGQEYLWDGDEKYWNRHSPILFPIVCGLWKDTYRIDGKEFKLSRHGFARHRLQVDKQRNRPCHLRADRL